MANLSAMAGLQAAVKAAAGLNLCAPVSASAMAQLSATLSAQVHSLNAGGAALNLAMPSLASLLAALASLIQLASLLGTLQARFGLDLRAAGAVPALQARLQALARASASARATASASAVASAMAAMGFSANAQGAAALNASAQAHGPLRAGPAGDHGEPQCAVAAGGPAGGAGPDPVRARREPARAERGCQPALGVGRLAAVRARGA